MNLINRKQDGEVVLPSRTKQIIEKYGLNLKKSLGQNFLIDQNIVQKIITAANLDQSKGVLEIGPGIGALTQQLAKVAGQVVAVEIDQRFIPVLAEVLDSYDHIEIVHGDVLKLDLSALLRDQFNRMSGISVVANLPYYITTPIVMKLLEDRLELEHIVVMIQKEVAERMTAKPGGKDYGSLSIAVQYYSVPQWVTTVPHTVFIPQPKVDSAVIKLSLRKTAPVQLDDERYFFQLIQACFAHRRKTILNNLIPGLFAKEAKLQVLGVLQQCDIDPIRRGETLHIEEYARLANALYPLSLHS